MVAALASLLVLGFLVVVHEAGHFIVARWVGVRVLRFSVGFGPRLATWKWGETEYALSLIPLGGYVKMAGEQRNEQTQQPYEYLSKPVSTRAAIVLAGPLVNYLVALVSLWVVFVIGFPELSPIVGNVVADMPAKAAGLTTGDRIVAVDGKPVKTWDELTTVIYASAEKPLTLEVARKDATQQVTVVPKAKTVKDPFGRSKAVGLIGIGPSGDFESFRVGPIEAIGRTWHQQSEWVAQTLLSLWSMGSGRMSVRESVTGPIGIVYLTSEAVQMGFAPLLFLVSLFSLSLALFNVFPIPILDGGHLLFLALEKLRGRPVSIKIQERSAQVSFVALMSLVFVICINDINRFGLLDKVVEWVKR